MAFVVKEILRKLRDRFAEQNIGMTIEQYFILNILDNEDGLILQELADIVERDKSAVLRHIDGLEKKYFITRVKDTSDKRRKLLLVTKRGLTVLAQARAIDRQLDRELTEHIGVDKFEKALSEMYSYLAEDEGDNRT